VKAVVIGDIHVSTEYFISQVKLLPWKYPVEIKGFDWYPQSKEEFQKVTNGIEKNGPENIPIPDGLMNELRDADAVFTHFCPVNKDMIEQAEKLKLIGTCRGGIEHISELASKKDIPVVNVIRNAEPVADFTLALILAETRNIARGHEEIKAGRWTKQFANTQHIDILRNLTVGVIGFGHIGKLVVQKLVSLGVNVLVHDAYYDQTLLDQNSEQVRHVSFKELLEKSDVVSIHVRMEPDAPPLINAEAIAQMKKTAVLVNTSRAYAVDEKALVNALENNLISGAALDVYWEEPLASDHPLLGLKNVTLTPHIAGDTALAIGHSPKLLVEKLIQMKDDFKYLFIR